jgi:hypothetical protein
VNGSVIIPTIQPGLPVFFYYINLNIYNLTGAERADNLIISYEFPIEYSELNPKDGLKFDISYDETFSKTLKYDHSYFDEVFYDNALGDYPLDARVTLATTRLPNEAGRVTKNLLVKHFLHSVNAQGAFVARHRQ